MTPVITVTTPPKQSYIEDVLLLPLDSATDDCFQLYVGRTYEALPSFPTPTPPLRLPAPCPMELHVPAIFGFKKISMLEEKHLTDTPDAIERLVELKSFINDLQRKRHSYWKRQGVVVSMGAGLSVVTSGISAVGGLLVAARQGDLLDTIKTKIQQAIQQINEIRNVYGRQELWEEGEALQRIDPDVFSLAIERYELDGSL